MKSHLEEHEITAAVAGLELEAVAAQHLGSCLSCRQRVSLMAEAIEQQRQHLEAEAPDWDRQREEIMAKLQVTPVVRTQRNRRWIRPILAAAAILVTAIALRVLWPPAPVVVDNGAATELAVEQILAEVDAVLADDSIPGFEIIEPGLEDAIYENGAS
ncbi:MAG: hypothetical protein P8127_12010 [Acidobacteriota bacterium]